MLIFANLDADRQQTTDKLIVLPLAAHVGMWGNNLQPVVGHKMFGNTVYAIRSQKYQ